jgi:hypothetical protein
MSAAIKPEVSSWKLQREAEAAQAIREALASAGEGDDAELIQDTIEGETGLFELLDALIEAEDEDLILIAGLAERIKAMTGRKSRLEKRKDERRAIIDQALSIAEITTMTRPTYTMTLAARRPGVIVSQEADIPAAFWKSEPKLDKAALLKALNAGEQIPGACLSNAAPTTTIRRN